MKTRPEVFIIESLSFEDERKKRFEGQILADILSLSDKRCEYYYLRTEHELRRILRKFTKSSYRYLHLSCHGNQNTFCTTLDDLSLSSFAQILRPHVRSRRLFLSACSLTSEHLAKLLIPGPGCYSILGPGQDVQFGDAAILWASLYHMMFAWDSTAMNGAVLRKRAQAVADMYFVKLNYFGRDRSSKNGFMKKELLPNGSTNPE